jgi:hypothetical protein
MCESPETAAQSKQDGCKAKASGLAERLSLFPDL